MAGAVGGNRRTTVVETSASTKLLQCAGFRHAWVVPARASENETPVRAVVAPRQLVGAKVDRLSGERAGSFLVGQASHHFEVVIAVTCELQVTNICCSQCLPAASQPPSSTNGSAVVDDSLLPFARCCAASR